MLSLATLCTGWAIGVEPGLLTHRQERVQWKGPAFRLVFFADLHAGAPHIDEKYIARLVQEINQTTPDLILIGGDLVITNLPGGKAISPQNVAKLLGQLRSRIGTFAVLGNHDWWNKPEEISSELRAYGIQTLDNESRLIEFKGIKFWLAGIADDYTHHSEPRKSLAQITTADPRILFMHDPGSLHDVSEPYLLALAGHLHGGQVALPFLGALIIPGRAARAWSGGWTKLENGPLFVTRGIGTSVLPVRFNAPPEYVIFDFGSDGDKN